MDPKAYISYSHTSQEHKDAVRQFAELLLHSHVQVALDQWDLKEGQSIHAFMQSMVVDSTITHVLIICDREYTRKANENPGTGVGTESQIISAEVYAHVDQTKFIPLIWECDEDGVPCIPVFLKGRMYIDFSSRQAYEIGYERLRRILFNKPMYPKPPLGPRPIFLEEQAPETLAPSTFKLATLQQAVTSSSVARPTARREFLEACYRYVDALRVRQPLDSSLYPRKIVDDFEKLRGARNLLVDWVRLECGVESNENFARETVRLLDRLTELCLPPEGVSGNLELWCKAHRLFLYETFIYLVAVLLDREAFDVLASLLRSRFAIPQRGNAGEYKFETFEVFYCWSDDLQSVLAKDGVKLLAPAGELIRLSASRQDVRFRDLIQADLLLFLVSILREEHFWYPQLLSYASYGTSFPFFSKSTRHAEFQGLAQIVGVASADELRRKFADAIASRKSQGWADYRWTRRGLESAINLENWDTVP